VAFLYIGTAQDSPKTPAVELEPFVSDWI